MSTTHPVLQTLVQANVLPESAIAVLNAMRRDIQNKHTHDIDYLTTQLMTQTDGQNLRTMLGQQITATETMIHSKLVAVENKVNQMEHQITAVKSYLKSIVLLQIVSLGIVGAGLMGLFA